MESYPFKDGRRMKQILLFLLLLLWLASSVVAQPSISSTSESFVNGEPFTISGTNFTSGPTVLVYDNFEGGSNNSAISTTSTVGSWSNVYTGHITYANDYHLSGSLSMEVDFVEGTLVGNNHASLIFSGATDIFFSYWQYLPTGRDVPGTNNGDGPNYKWWWLGDASVGWPWGSDYVIVTVDNSFGDNLFIPANDGSPPTRYPTSNYWVSTYMSTRGRWVRETVYMKNSTSASGAYWFQEVTAGNPVAIRINGTGVTAHTGETWKNWDFPGYGRGDNNSVIYYDDVYVSVGADSRARSRVEIGDNEAYSSCTNLSICNATSWSSTSITAVTRQSSFSNGTAYLFVVDSNNVASSGYQITLGSGSSATNLQWVGGTSNDPSVASNWNPAQVPTSLDTITVNTGSVNMTIGSKLTCAYFRQLSGYTGAITLNDTLVSNYLGLGTCTMNFYAPCVIKDSVVYASASTPVGYTGSRIVSVAGSTLRVKLNGNVGTPRVVMTPGSKIKW